MVYSKRVTDLQQIYQLTPWMMFSFVCLSHPVPVVAKRTQLYLDHDPPKVETAQRGAAQACKG